MKKFLDKLKIHLSAFLIVEVGILIAIALGFKHILSILSVFQ